MINDNAINYDAKTGEFLHEDGTVMEGFRQDVLSRDRDHRRHIKKLLLTFVGENRTFTAQDICGSYWWDNFTDDEKHSAEYWIGMMIVEMGLPLCPDRRQTYPEPRRYYFNK